MAAVVRRCGAGLLVLFWEKWRGTSSVHSNLHFNDAQAELTSSNHVEYFYAGGIKLNSIEAIPQQEQKRLSHFQDYSYEIKTQKLLLPILNVGNMYLPGSLCG